MSATKIIDYLHDCRWCDFKKKIEDNQISSLNLEQLPFDNNRKLFIIGEVSFNDGDKRFFSMPLAIKEERPTDGKYLALGDGYYYTDATLEPDFWQSFTTFMNENNGKITFPNGWTLENSSIGGFANMMEEFPAEPSKALGVEQSNTTLKIGDGKLAFKLERMLDFSPELNSEFEMNDKLMRENAAFMPKTFGGLIWRRPDGSQAAGGIIQEFVKNKGDMWNYLQSMLQSKLRINYLIQRDLSAEDNPEFMQLIKTLSHRTKEMNTCLSKDDDAPEFKPEAADKKFIDAYEKQLRVLLFQTKRDIVEKLGNLPADIAEKAKKLIIHWEEYTNNFVTPRLEAIRSGAFPTQLNRVHGDFHLGQVMVTPDNDVRFIDFAGEPALPMRERKQKHLSVRDVAGMYRSIQGYLGAVAVEEYANKAPTPLIREERKNWGQKAIKPLISRASQEFLGDYQLSNPWLGLEVLRKNLYEVKYEVSQRPEMAYVPIGGLYDLFGDLPYDKSREFVNDNTISHDHRVG